MPDTIPDIAVNSEDYIDVYAAATAAAGAPIAVGTSLSVQYKGDAVAMFQESAVKPAAKSVNGVHIEHLDSVKAINNPPGLWARGDGFITVQVIA